MKNSGCGGKFSSICMAKSGMLWTYALGFLLRGSADVC